MTNLTRRSFFQRTAGAVITATIAGRVVVEGEILDSWHVHMDGSRESKPAMILCRAIDYALRHDKSRVLVVFKDYPTLKLAAESVNYPHFGRALKYYMVSTNFKTGNGSIVNLVTAENPEKVKGLAVHATYTYNVPKNARNIAFKRARLEPHYREWS